MLGGDGPTTLCNGVLIDPIRPVSDNNSTLDRKRWCGRIGGHE